MGDAGAEVAVAQPRRLRRLRVALKLGVPARRPPRRGSRRRRAPWRPSRPPRAAAQPGPRPARPPRWPREARCRCDPRAPRAGPRAGRPARPTGRRAQIRRASQGATAPTSTRLPNTASRIAGHDVHARAHRGEQVKDQAVQQGQRPRTSATSTPRAAASGRGRARSAPLGSRGRRVAFAAWTSSGSPSLARCPTADAVELQEAVRARRQAGEIPDFLLVLEHPPVYTRGRRTEAGRPADGRGLVPRPGHRRGRQRPRRPGDLPRARAAGGLPDHGHRLRGRVRDDDGGGDGGRAGRRGHRRRGARRAAHRRLGRRGQDRVDRRARVARASPPTGWP